MNIFFEKNNACIVKMAKVEYFCPIFILKYMQKFIKLN